MINRIEYDPLYVFINKLKTIEENLTFDSFKEHLLKVNKNIQLKYSDLDNNLVLLFCNRFDIFDEENLYKIRSTILNKDTLQIVATQFNNVMYDKFNTNVEWSNVEVFECYAGTTLLIYYYNDKWNISTRRCLDANKSLWHNEKSHKEQFNEISEGLYEKLNKNYFYNMILLHPNDFHLVNISRPKLVIISINDLQTFNEINDIIIHDSIIEQTKKNFNSLEELNNELNTLSNNNLLYNTITSEGFIIKTNINNDLATYKFQSNFYKLNQTVANNTPFINKYRLFLILYLDNSLLKYVNLLPKKDQQTLIFSITKTFDFLISSCLYIYHISRKKNKDFYNILPKTHKKLIYLTHGLFLSSKKNIDYNIISSIIKNMDFNELINLLLDHNELYANKEYLNLLSSLSKPVKIENINKQAINQNYFSKFVPLLK